MAYDKEVLPTVEDELRQKLKEVLAEVENLRDQRDTAVEMIRQYRRDSIRVNRSPYHEGLGGMGHRDCTMERQQFVVRLRDL